MKTTNKFKKGDITKMVIDSVINCEVLSLAYYSEFGEPVYNVKRTSKYGDHGKAKIAESMLTF